MTPFSFQTITITTDLDNLAVSACEDLDYSRFLYRFTHNLFSRTLLRLLKILF